MRSPRVYVSTLLWAAFAMEAAFGLDSTTTNAPTISAIPTSVPTPMALPIQAPAVTAPSPLLESSSVPWVETFLLPNGSIEDIGSTAWKATRMTGRFNVEDGYLVVEGFGSVGVLTTAPIDISNAGAVDVSLDVVSKGPLEFHQDYVELYVQVDDGEEQYIGKVAGRGHEAGVTITGKDFTGNSMVVIVRAYVSFALEFYLIDRLSVKPAASRSLPPVPTLAPMPTPVAPPVSPPPVYYPDIVFSLVNAFTDRDIGFLRDGRTISLRQLGTEDLNVRVAPGIPLVMGSVVFHYDGLFWRTENKAPYSFAGDIGLDYNAWTPSLGQHRIEATIYSDKRGTGVVVSRETVHFNVVA